MGFGFNLLFVFVLVPLTAILILSWLISKKKVFGKALGIIWVGIIGIVLLSSIAEAMTSKVLLTKDDFYGEYTIDRTFFPGEQANWQYDHFRFEINRNDSIFFHLTDKEKIVRTYKGTITTLTPYKSERLVIKMEQPTHHILTGNPTIYRDTRSFYLVFNSPEFSNVFFSKGEWTPR